MMELKEKKRWVLFGLPWTFTSYEITDEMVNINEGFLSKRENSCYLYKVTDVELTASLFERMFGLGTVICYTGDVTHSTLKLEHIRNSAEMKKVLLNLSEEQRMKKRTINTQDIDGSGNGE